MDELLDAVEQDEQDLYEHLRLVVDKGQSLLRIDKFLMHRIENATRNRIQNAIEAGNVLVNDKAIKSSYKVKPLDVISVVLPHPPRDTEVYPEDIPLDILFVLNNRINRIHSNCEAPDPHRMTLPRYTGIGDHIIEFPAGTCDGWKVGDKVAMYLGTPLNPVR